MMNFLKSVVSPNKDDKHNHVWNLQGGQAWLYTDKLVALGGHILYDKMVIQLARSNNRKTQFESPRYQLSLPLDFTGQSKMASLTTLAYDNPALSELGIPLIALFLDNNFQDAIVVKDREIRQGAFTMPTYEDADLMKRLLSSGPMPIKFDLYSERAINPVLGATFQKKGFSALIISIVLLGVLMSLNYLRHPWFLFVYFISLFFWFLCIVTLANFHLFRISLLQLAAFVLLLGMNTDTLVLVFEDLRHEFAKEKRFTMNLVGEAFKTEWMVVFWGMVTTLVVIIPLALQGGIFMDYVKLLGLGMGSILSGLFSQGYSCLYLSQKNFLE